MDDRIMQEKIVLITGASSGIGAACAHFFAKMGAKLLLCARRFEALEALAQQLRLQYQVEIYPFQLDVRNHAEISAAFKSLPMVWQAVDILVNNAGLALGLELFHEGEVTDWDTMIDTNMKGLLYMTKAVLPTMVAHNSGHIINIGSISSHRVYAKGGVYCATKHAVKALSEGLRLEMERTKVRVSLISPGPVETNFSKVRFKGDEKKAAQVYEHMKPLTAEDVAEAVLYCAMAKPHININEIILMPTGVC